MITFCQYKYTDVHIQYNIVLSSFLFSVTSLSSLPPSLPSFLSLTPLFPLSLSLPLSLISLLSLCPFLSLCSFISVPFLSPSVPFSLPLFLYLSLPLSISPSLFYRGHQRRVKTSEKQVFQEASCSAGYHVVMCIYLLVQTVAY